jgi:hypothetical protein
VGVIVQLATPLEFVDAVHVSAPLSVKVRLFPDRLLVPDVSLAATVAASLGCPRSTPTVESFAIPVTLFPASVKVVTETGTYFVSPAANAVTTLLAPVWTTLNEHDATPEAFVTPLQDSAVAPDPMVNVIVLPEIGVLPSSFNTAEKVGVESFANDVAPVYASVVSSVVTMNVRVKLTAV